MRKLLITIILSLFSYSLSYASFLGKFESSNNNTIPVTNNIFLDDTTRLFPQSDSFMEEVANSSQADELNFDIFVFYYPGNKENINVLDFERILEGGGTVYDYISSLDLPQDKRWFLEDQVRHWGEIDCSLEDKRQELDNLKILYPIVKDLFYPDIELAGMDRKDLENIFGYWERGSGYKEFWRLGWLDYWNLSLEGGLEGSIGLVSKDVVPGSYEVVQSNSGTGDLYTAIFPHNSYVEYDNVQLDYLVSEDASAIISLGLAELFKDFTKLESINFKVEGTENKKFWIKIYDENGTEASDLGYDTSSAEVEIKISDLMNSFNLDWKRIERVAIEIDKGDPPRGVIEFSDFRINFKSQTKEEVAKKLNIWYALLHGQEVEEGVYFNGPLFSYFNRDDPQYFKRNFVEKEKLFRIDIFNELSSWTEEVISLTDNLSLDEAITQVTEKLERWTQNQEWLEGTLHNTGLDLNLESFAYGMNTTNRPLFNAFNEEAELFYAQGMDIEDARHQAYKYGNKTSEIVAQEYVFTELYKRFYMSRFSQNLGGKGDMLPLNLEELVPIEVTHDEIMNEKEIIIARIKIKESDAIEHVRRDEIVEDCGKCGENDETIFYWEDQEIDILSGYKARVHENAPPVLTRFDDEWVILDNIGHRFGMLFLPKHIWFYDVYGDYINPTIDDFISGRSTTTVYFPISFREEINLEGN